MEPLPTSHLPGFPQPPPRLAEPAWQAPQALPTIDFEGFFSMLARRKWIILLFTALATGLAFAYLRVAPKLYESHGQLEIGSASLKVSSFDPIEDKDFTPIDALKTIEQVLGSTTVIDRMVKNQKLAEHFQGSAAAKIGQIQGGSKIALIKGTRIVSISFRHPDPEVAKKVVDAYLAEYPAFESDQTQKDSVKAKQQLADAEKALAAKINLAHKELEDFRAANPSFTEAEASEALASTDVAYTSAMTNVAKLEADLKGLANGKAPQTTNELLRIPSIIQQTEVKSLQEKISDAEAAFSGQGQVRVFDGNYLYKHPKFITADNKLKSLQRQLEAAVKSAYAGLERDLQSAKATVEKLRVQREQKRTEASALDVDREKYKRLKAGLEADETVLNQTRGRLREAEVSSEIQANNFKVVQEPMVAEAPVSPKKPLILAGGLMLGLLSGLGLSLALQLLDRKVRSTADVARQLPNLPCLASLPETRMKAPKDRLILSTQPQSAAAEAFRNLRASLSMIHPSIEPRTIVFTSAASGDGKSHCALNCAAAFAMQGQQTLLIEADLRCPSLEPVLLRGQNLGLSAHLRGRAEPHEICYSTQVQNLYFIPAGELRSNPSEMLSSPAMLELLAKSAQCFDKVIIDTPPLGPVSDALLPARQANAICLVIKANSTTRQALRQATDQLAQINRPPCGYVLNGVAKTHNASTYTSYVSRQQNRLFLEASLSPLTPVIEATTETPLFNKAALL